MQLRLLFLAALLRSAGTQAFPMMGRGMAEVQREAAARSGVSLDEAFAVDQVNLYDRLGLDVLKKFSREFYTSVYADTDQWYRDLFKDRPIEDSIENQWTFLAQRLGGPPLYTERKGPPAMMWRHKDYPVNETTAEKWLQHADEAFNAAPEIDADSRQRLEKFFRFFAYFLVVGREKGYGTGCPGMGGGMPGGGPGAGRGWGMMGGGGGGGMMGHGRGWFHAGGPRQAQKAAAEQAAPKADEQMWEQAKEVMGIDVRAEA